MPEVSDQALAGTNQSGAARRPAGHGAQSGTPLTEEHLRKAHRVRILFLT